MCTCYTSALVLVIDSPIMTLSLVSYGDGQLGRDASSFNISKLERTVAALVADPAWKGIQPDLVASCQNPTSSVTPRQQAIYSYLCVGWHLLTDCDYKQATEDRLDEEGQRRRAEFLLGSYAMSPKTLFPDEISHSRWSWCSSSPPHDRVYEAALNVTKCHMQRYIIGGSVDIASLLLNINLTDKDSASARLLIGLMTKCAGYRKSGTPAFPIIDVHPSMMAEAFIDCWVTHGVYSVAKQEAEKTASEFSDGCSFSVEPFKHPWYKS